MLRKIFHDISAAWVKLGAYRLAQLEIQIADTDSDF